MTTSYLILITFLFIEIVIDIKNGPKGINRPFVITENKYQQPWMKFLKGPLKVKPKGRLYEEEILLVATSHTLIKDIFKNLVRYTRYTYNQLDRKPGTLLENN